MRSVRDMYEQAADGYAATRETQLVPASRPLLAGLPLSSARVVVDAGTGTGALLPALRAAAPQARIVGLDLAAAMLGHAARRDATVLAQADLTHPPLRPGSADVLVCAFVLFHLPDPPAAVRALAGALRPGGAFAAATWAKDPYWPAAAAFAVELEAAGAPAVASTRVGAAFTETPETLTELVASAGLRVLETELAPLGGPVASGAELVAEWTALGSTAARFAQLDPAVQERVRSAAIERIDAMSADERRDPHQVIRLWAVRD